MLTTLTKSLVRSFVPRDVRNWARSPADSAKWVWDEIKFASGVKKFVQLRPGWSLTCHPAAYRCAYHLQINDPEQVAEFDGFINSSAQGMVLFDIGAHFGLFSLAALHYGGQRAKAIAVDPSPVAVRFLKVHAELNGVAERLQVVQASVNEQAGWRNMVAVGVLASGFYVAPSKNHSAREVIRTRATSLDELAEEFNVVPTHIKIDVEGDEEAVLRGGKQLLSQVQAPALFIELHNQLVCERGSRPADTLLTLRAYGYQTFTVDSCAIDDATILSKPLIRVIAKKP